MQDNWEINDIEKLAQKIKNGPQEAYQYIQEKFSFVPRCFLDSLKVQWDLDPIGAINAIEFDVDGSRGFSTNYTPKELIRIYQKCWEKSLEINQIHCDRKTKYERYHAQWLDKDWGEVSGDVIFSFPKDELLKEIEALKVDKRYIMLFARLCYTLGNFIPVPKKGRGKLSVNTLHSYHRSYINGKQWERFDKYIFDSCISNKSKYNEYYNKFQGYYGNFLLSKNFFDGCLVSNNNVIDLVTLNECNDGKFGEINTKEDIENYIINICASIIIRGNKMRKCMEEPD